MRGADDYGHGRRLIDTQKCCGDNAPWPRFIALLDCAAMPERLDWITVTTSRGPVALPWCGVPKLGARPEIFAICRQDANFGTPQADAWVGGILLGCGFLGQQIMSDSTKNNNNGLGLLILCILFPPLIGILFLIAILRLSRSS